MLERYIFLKKRSLEHQIDWNVRNEIAQNARIFVQTITYNGKLNENYLTKRVCLNENLTQKWSMPFQEDPNLIVEE